MKSNKTGVIVLGGHVQGYGIVRVYGENNIPSVVIDKDKHNIARHSKYCEKFFHVEYNGLITLLLDLGNDAKYKNWLLIPTDDYYVRLLSQNKNELNKYFTVTVDDWEIIDLFFNKRKSYPLAKELCIPIPNTYYPESIDDIEIISKSVDYPCIIKPSVMLDFYRYFKKKVFVCNSPSELVSNYNKALKIIKPSDILIQEIIPGPSENQYSVGIFYNKDQSYNYLVCRRKRQHPIDFGNATTFAETVNLPVLIEYAEKILKKSGFFGICEVEFKFDERDGKYKFFEINPRTWKWHLISIPAKVPFLMSIYNYLTEGSAIIQKEYSDSCWRDIITDIPIVTKLIYKRIYIKPKKKPIVNAVNNLRDMKPFIYQIITLPYLIFKR